MTDAPPPRFTRRNRGTGHSYTLDGQRIPGVTTVLNTMAKPALTGWAARTAAEYAVNHWDELDGLPLTERLAAISSAHTDKSRKAMTRGTRIHTFGWQLAQGLAVDVPAELAEPVDAYARFLDTWEITPVFTELPVCNTGHHYGGTLDAIVRSPRLGAVLLDIKTGGVFREVSMQLAAYRYANVALVDGKNVDVDPDAIDACYVAQIYGDSVDLVPVEADQSTWRSFTYLLAVYRWVEASKDESPIGRPVYPEEVAS